MLTNEVDLLAIPAFAPGEPPAAREAEVFAGGRP